MRLINTTTKALEEFEFPDTPPYAILSHTWTHGEIMYQDLGKDRKADKAIGYAKLDNGCRVAAAAGYDHFWLDTCCIDKTSNAELSEAINSMFQWYHQAGICFAYLSDVPKDVDLADANSTFSHSRWFTRGWTLQELLAPSEVLFLADDWTEIASRNKSASLITQVTGIPSLFLLGQNLQDASVAMRMSWAANRKTTKAEDIAYCLLGIFDIHMPLLYGEREAGAFRRLQQEILRYSDDQSIFAWKTDNAHTPSQNASARQTFSLLAHSPASFRWSQNLVEATPPVVTGYLDGIRTPTLFNNKGLHLSLPVIYKPDGRVLAILNCSRLGNENRERIAIWLRDVSTNGGRYIRVERHTFEIISLDVITRSAVYSSISGTKGEDESPRSSASAVTSLRRHAEVGGAPGRSWRHHSAMGPRPRAQTDGLLEGTLSSVKVSRTEQSSEDDAWEDDDVAEPSMGLIDESVGWTALLVVSFSVLLTGALVQ
jgi:hypothetical protein